MDDGLIGERTHELRELLYAEGVAYEEHDDEYITGYLITKWTASDGRIASYCEDERGVSCGMGEITPREAVAATLGIGREDGWVTATSENMAKYGWYRADSKSNWAKLFGTPKRVARTFYEINPLVSCGDCVFNSECSIDGGCFYESSESLLEWLESEAVG